MLFKVKSSHYIPHLFGVGYIQIVKVDVHVPEDVQLIRSRCAKVWQKLFPILEKLYHFKVAILRMVAIQSDSTRFECFEFFLRDTYDVDVYPDYKTNPSPLIESRLMDLSLLFLWLLLVGIWTKLCLFIPLNCTNSLNSCRQTHAVWKCLRNLRLAFVLLLAWIFLIWPSRSCPSDLRNTFSVQSETERY